MAYECIQVSCKCCKMGVREESILMPVMVFFGRDRTIGVVSIGSAVSVGSAVSIMSVIKIGS